MLNNRTIKTVSERFISLRVADAFGKSVLISRRTMIIFSCLFFVIFKYSITYPSHGFFGYG